uniref:Uncharacterized protein n=1 Tax=Arundo donax TaxID=35708 RepID=A0A0A8XXS9_ARUDO
MLILKMLHMRGIHRMLDYYWRNIYSVQQKTLLLNLKLKQLDQKKGYIWWFLGAKAKWNCREL